MIKQCQELSGILLYWLSNKWTGHFYEFWQQTHSGAETEDLLLTTIAVAGDSEFSWGTSRCLIPKRLFKDMSNIYRQSGLCYRRGLILGKLSLIVTGWHACLCCRERNYLVFKAISHKTRYCLFQDWLVYKRALLKTY